MECTQSRILTRTEILDILKMRFIETKHIEKMSSHELKSIHNNYVIPLEQRCNFKRTLIKKEDNPSIDLNINKLFLNNDTTLIFDEVMSERYPSYYREQNKKRPVQEGVNHIQLYTDSLLITATKRIKIDSI